MSDDAKPLFRDDEQRLRAVRTLLAVGGLDENEWWTERGPTKAARNADRTGGRNLEPWVRALVLSAWAFWGGCERLRFDQLLGLHDVEPVYKLAIASIYGHDAIDAWLARPDDREQYANETEVDEQAARLFDAARAALAENGDLPMNMGAAPDACALGVVHMADYAMQVGVPVVEDDDARHGRARQLAVQALELFATLTHYADDVEEMKRESAREAEEEDGEC